MRAFGSASGRTANLLEHSSMKVFILVPENCKGYRQLWCLEKGFDEVTEICLHEVLF